MKPPRLYDPFLVQPPEAGPGPVMGRWLRRKKYALRKGKLAPSHDGGPSNASDRLDAQRAAEDFLVVVDTRYQPRRTHPLNEGGFFRVFVALNDEEPGSLLAFAHRYGHLSSRLATVDLGDGECALGEPVSLWRRHIRRIRLLERVWRMANSSDRVSLDELAQLVQVGDPFSLGADRRGFPMSAIEASWTDVAGSGYLVTTDSLTILCIDGNPPHLRQAALKLLQLELGRDLAGSMVPTVDLGPKSRLSLFARDLLGAVYASFAEALVGPFPEHRYCLHCRRPLMDENGDAGAMESKKPRNGRKYCCEACGHAYRERARRARKRSLGSSNTSEMVHATANKLDSSQVAQDL